MTPADDGGGTPARDGGSGCFQPSAGTPPDGEGVEIDRVEGWPAPLRGVTETIAATRGPDDRWNHAALGVTAPTPNSSADGGDDRPATARTWGLTRTRRNLEERGEAYVQFARDPIDFVAAALDVHETDDPILDRSAAWARVEATAVDRTEETGTEIVAWRLEPVEAAVRERAVPTLDRGRSAVVEATVAASRLDVDAYDEAELRERVAWLGDVVERCGSERDVAAFERIEALVGNAEH